MTTSSLQSQININTRPLQDAMNAAFKTQLELIETLKKQNVALNRINLLPKMHTSDILKSSGVESAMNQMRMVLRSTNYNDKYIKRLRNSLVHEHFTSNRVQIATYMQQLRTVFKDQAILNSSLYVTNDAISSETISEIEEISDYVEETVIALTNDNSITRREYFERFNDYWVGLISIINNKKTMAVKALLSFLVATVLQPVGIALTTIYVIDEFIDKKPETVTEAKNVLKDIPMNKELKTNYRMVIKDTLVVRTRPKTKSNVAYVLDKSSIVFIEEKKKNWSKVLFRNEAGEDQSGWVYTRYIKKLD
ncbi:SH3 domain-containing protein [Bacillus amyloliquefaciens]|uniref:SH3 domain-containing protein n=1 Tax=Bacillus amyloliquefaciens TaxID=1390 RepID=UPI000693795A|nr:SH3 domain-containing protein [Bacillus amyloliquefaciens]MDH3087691.1 SH3 domain-containing protein [Bacillus amyloliquefaciens]